MRFLLKTIPVLALSASLFLQDAQAFGPCDLSQKVESLPQLKIVTKGDSIEVLAMNARQGQPVVVKVYYSLLFINEGFLAAGKLGLRAQKNLALALDLKEEADVLNQTISNLDGDTPVEEKNASIVKVQKDMNLAKKVENAIKEQKDFDDAKKQTITKAYINSLTADAAMLAIVQEAANLTLSGACVVDKIKNQDATLVSEIANAAFLSTDVIKTWPNAIKVIAGNAKSFNSTSKKNKKMFKKVSKKAKMKLPKFKAPKPRSVESEL